MKNLEAIKKEVASKMKPSSDGKCSICGRNHNKNTHAKDKGYASLNPSHKSKDNMAMEGKNEQEKA